MPLIGQMALGGARSNRLTVALHCKTLLADKDGKEASVEGGPERKG
jgi:hypothetical protein